MKPSLPRVSRKFPVLPFHLPVTFVDLQHLLFENIEHVLSFACNIITMQYNYMSKCKDIVPQLKAVPYSFERRSMASSGTKCFSLYFTMAFSKCLSF